MLLLQAGWSTSSAAPCPACPGRKRVMHTETCRSWDLLLRDNEQSTYTAYKQQIICVFMLERSLTEYQDFGTITHTTRLRSITCTRAQYSAVIDPVRVAHSLCGTTVFGNWRIGAMLGTVSKAWLDQVR